MRAWTIPWLGLVACGCTGGTAPAALQLHWLIGIERMQDDPLLMLPNTNRFLNDLAAMPSTQVVFLGSAENAGLFAANATSKLRVWTWLHGERSCLQVTYTVSVAGQQEATYGLVIPPLAAGPEPDSACVDRAATEFYQALVRQGL